jgi:hypothetical protein
VQVMNLAKVPRIRDERHNLDSGPLFGRENSLPNGEMLGLLYPLEGS